MNLHNSVGGLMNGKWWGDFRSGTRSEYLALYGLSRVASVCPIPRQEDFGIRDLACVLMSQRGRMIYPESAFYVQVKANADPFTFDEDAVRWIAEHMDQPLFICVADKKDESLSLYSCAPIWWALFDPEIEVKSIRIHPGTIGPLPPIKPDQAGQCDIGLGPPVLSQTISDLEQPASTAYSVLRAWIEMDAANLASKRIGRIAARHFKNKWMPNEVPKPEYTRFFFYGGRAPWTRAESDLAPILTALAHNYRDALDRDAQSPERAKLDAVVAMLRALPVEFLDGHGQQFIDGKMDIPNVWRAQRD